MTPFSPARCLTFVALAVAALLAAIAGAQPPGNADDPVLVGGNPPLLQSDVDAWKHLVELAFGATLTKDQNATLQDQLLALWRKGEGPARDQLMQAKSAWQQIGSVQGAQQEMMRLALREQLLDAARRDPSDPVGALVLSVYDASSPVVVEGQPPLRRGSVNALVSLLEWLAGRAAGEDARLTDVERQQFIAQLIQYYPHAAPGDQMLLEHMEATVAWLHAEWEKAGPEGQANFRANLARALGIQRSPLPAPYAGATETWEHPDGVFQVDYPADWSARYAGLPDGSVVAGWTLLDVTVLGEAPSAALELGALPEAGSLIAAVAPPEDLVKGRLAIEEAVFSLAHDLLSPFGAVEPLADPTVGKDAVLTTWRQQTGGVEYFAWLSVVVLPQLKGDALPILTLSRAPAAEKADFEPAFSRIAYSLRSPGPNPKTLPDLLDFPSAHDLALDLLNTPLRDQMDMVEGLTSGVR
jgi:hypothetical protein